MTVFRTSCSGVAFLACIGLNACTGGGATLSPPPPPTSAPTITKLSGDGLSAYTGTATLVLPQVQVKDKDGQLVANTTVTFAVASGGGAILGATQTTNSFGQAQSGAWTLGAGANTLTVSALGISVTFTATGYTAADLSLTIVSGNNQTVGTGVPFPVPIVSITGPLGFAVPNVPVAFTLTSGGGSVVGANKVTDTRGYASVDEWRLGPGANTLAASVPGASGSPKSISATGLVIGGMFTTQGWACAVTVTSIGYCWGQNSAAGVLGDGTTLTRLRPVPIQGGLAVAATSGALLNSCLLTNAGAAYCWGANGDGTTGDGTTTTKLAPSLVLGGLTFQSIASGLFSQCGLTTLGAAYCWGYNSSGIVGQTGYLGDGTTVNRTIPTAVAGGFTFQSLSMGDRFACGATVAGAAYCWGENNFGSLGIGTTTGTSSVPVLVSGGLLLHGLVSGASRTCGLTASGAAWCWGGISQGGVTVATPVPVAVPGGFAFQSLAVTTTHACGVTAAGAAYCWGDDDHGQLGGGLGTSSQVPVPVAGGFVFKSLSAASQYTCGTTTAGGALCWGTSTTPQLGDGMAFAQPTPVAVLWP